MEEIDSQINLKLIYYKAHEKALETPVKEIKKKSETSLLSI